MKKIILISLSVLSFSSAFAQAPVNTQMLSRENSKVIEGNKPATNYHHSRAVIWTDDFSTPANWTITSAVPNNQNWVIGTAVPSGGFAIPGIQSSSAANGFAMFDSDGMTGAAVDQIGNLTNANSINCSGHPGVLLKFEQSYRRFYDSSFVFVSNDNVNWTKFPVNQDVAVNAYNDDPDGDANPGPCTVNISNVAGNSATVWIRFQFYSPMSLQPTLSGWCYAWMIDDISVEDAPANDMVASKYWLGDGYTMYPVGQEQPIYFDALVSNQGSALQTNVKLTATVTPGGFTDVSPTMDFAATAGDTLQVNTLFTPGALGTYSVDYSVAGDQTDDVPADNANTETFSVHAYQFARDNGTYDGGGLWNGGDGFTIANYYFCPAATDVASIDVSFQESTSVGSIVVAKIYTWDNTATDWVEVGTSGNYTISANDISTVNGPAKFVTINLSGITAIAAGAEVLAGVETLGTPDTVVISASSELLQPNIGSVIFDPGATTPGWFTLAGNDAAMVRLNVNGFVGVKNLTEIEISNSLFPNPTNNLTEMNYELNSTSNVSLNIYNTLGQLVYNNEIGKQTKGSYNHKINTAKFAAGIYSVVLTSDNNSSVNKLVVTH